MESSFPMSSFMKFYYTFFFFSNTPPKSYLYDILLHFINTPFNTNIHIKIIQFSKGCLKLKLFTMVISKSKTYFSSDLVLAFT